LVRRYFVSEKTHLASEGMVAVSTQKQALNALVFLYRDVLHIPPDGEITPVRGKLLPRPPAVLTRNETLGSV